MLLNKDKIYLFYILRKYNFLERLSRAERLLKEAGLFPEGWLTKAQKEQILRAHFEEETEAKARALKDFTKAQRRVLMENWIVGKLTDKEIIRIIEKIEK